MEYFKKIVLSTSGLIGSVLNKEIGFKNKGFRLSEVLLETSLILWIQQILKKSNRLSSTIGGNREMSNVTRKTKFFHIS